MSKWFKINDGSDANKGNKIGSISLVFLCMCVYVNE